MDLNAFELLVALAILASGDSKEVIKTIKDVENRPSDEELEESFKKVDGSGWTPVTILDERYPEHLKDTMLPELVLFIEGDVDWVLNTLTEGRGNIVGILGREDKLPSGDEFEPALLSVNKDAVAAYLGSHVIELSAVDGSNTAYITLSATEDDVSRDALAYLFGKICSKIIFNRAKESDANMSALLSSLQLGAEIYCAPTSKKSWTNSLIKSGAYLFEGIEDLSYGD